MKKHLIPIVWLAFAALILAGCEGVRQQAVPTPSQPFGPGVKEIPQKITGFTSFRWAADAALPRERSDARAWRAELKGAVERELEKRGYKRATFGRGELELGYFMALADGSSIRSQGALNQAAARGSRTGAILIEARDPETGELIWHAAANAALPLRLSPKEGRLLLESYVAAMLRALPPVM